MGKFLFVAVAVLCFISMGYSQTKVYFNGKRVYDGEIRVIKNGIECVLVKNSKEKKQRFWISKHPVTQKQYQDIMGDSSSYYTENGDTPIENVSRNDAAATVKKTKRQSKERRKNLRNYLKNKDVLI